MNNLFNEFPEACELALELPDAHEKVIIAGVGFRTVGYVDNDGVWRQHFDDAVLHNVVDWYALK